MNTIREIQKAVHKNAQDKGFYEEGFNFGEKIALIHSEVSEALEAHRNNKICRHGIDYSTFHHDNDGNFKSTFESTAKDTLEDELADAVIRILDLAEYLDIDLEAHILAKHRYNTMREHKHGKSY